jgi:hypothetical protein
VAYKSLLQVASTASANKVYGKYRKGKLAKNMI